MKIHIYVRAALLALTSSAILGTAMPAHADNTQPPDNRFYVSGMLSRAIDWNISSGKSAGFFIGIGKPITNYFGLELNAQQYKVQTDPNYGSTDVRQRTYGINGLIFLHRGSSWNPYVELGLGRMNSNYNGTSDNNNYLTAGIGFFWRVASYLDIRGDLRFDRMLDGIGPNNNVTISNPVASLGIAIPFGAPPQAERAASPPPPPPPPPADSDNDGVPDTADQCPNTPSGVAVDDHGCPLDSDHDGVPDYLDQCPNTPAGMPVDVHGCPIQRTITLHDVHFVTDSSKLSGDDQTSLDDAAATLKKFPVLRAEVAGYTDSIGAAGYNQKLSQERAQSVKQYLVAHGVAADRLTTHGYGESDPVASNKTAAGRAKNRRVELHILNLDQLKGAKVEHN